MNDSYWVVQENCKDLFKDKNLYHNSFNTNIASIAFTGYGSYTRTCDKTIRMSGNGGLFGNPSANKSGYSQGTIKTTAHCTSETMRSCLPCIL